jgi:Sec-independent protein secretion pathway component TatC
MVGYQSEKGLYEEIKEDNLAASLIASFLILTIGFVLSHFVLNPFIFEWISKNAQFIPLM